VPCLETCLEEVEINEDPEKAATERIGLKRRVVAQMAARRQDLAMILFPEFVMGRRLISNSVSRFLS
jgi:hypothetical protein